MTISDRGDARAAAGGITRRGLLAGAAIGGAAALAGFPLVAGRAEARTGGIPERLPERAWRELAQRLSGRLVRPGDDGFQALARPYNLRYADRLPAGIARCKDAADVGAALAWCREHEVRLVARGGGHSYGGFSTTDGLMIDISPIGHVEFDAASGRARVGGGARNGRLYAALSRAGVSVTHGRCPTVGAGGFLLGGGVGFDMRAHGFGSDHLVSTTLVLADGRVMRASAKENPYLFWACRGGGGGNFGINTEFVVETHPVRPNVAFKIVWTERLQKLLPALVEALEGAPARLGSKVTLQRKREAAGDTMLVELLGQLDGTEAELDAILAPAYAVARPQKATIEAGPYWKGQALLVDDSPPERFRERSRFVDRRLGGEAIDAVFAHMRRWPGAAGEVGIFKVFQTGGATNRMSPKATAFAHRESHWLAAVTSVWEAGTSEAAVARLHAWQDEFYAAVIPFCGPGAYQNFIDPSLANWAHCYYRGNLDRLREIKAKVDPGDLFHFPQSIRPAV